MGLAPLAWFLYRHLVADQDRICRRHWRRPALIANWTPLALFYRAFAGVLGWFSIRAASQLPAQRQHLRASPHLQGLFTLR